MTQDLKLIRFTSGEQVVAEVDIETLNNDKFKIKLGNTYKVIQERGSYGIQTSLVNWMPMRESTHMWVATRDISTIVDVNEDTRQMIAQFQAEEEEYAQANQIIKEAIRDRDLDDQELEDLYEMVMSANTDKLYH
jgi:hypothetical protein